MQTLESRAMDQEARLQTFVTDWERQFEQLAGSDASKLLEISSMLNPDAIPEHLFRVSKTFASNHLIDLCKEEDRCVITFLRPFYHWYFAHIRNEQS